MTLEVPNAGMILINLGTPEAPTRSAVARYLVEFLGDPLVITVPTPLRWMLCRLIALLRSKRSAAAYASIWTEQGSPLLVHAQAHADAVNAHPSCEGRVRLAMRYGSPSITQAFESLRSQGCDQFIVMPLYPQYARATTLSTLREVSRVAKHLGVPTERLSWVPPFYDHPRYIQAYAELLREQWDEQGIDCVLMSYHGLPVKQVGPVVCQNKTCDRQSGACPAITASNETCYRAQCFATSRCLAAALGLQEEQYAVGFQSRLGRLPWIGPDSVALLDDLYARGVRRLAVISPAFVADCLETEEELGLAMRHTWCDKEGASFMLLPCLNEHTEWVSATAALFATAVPLVEGELR